MQLVYSLAAGTEPLTCKEILLLLPKIISGRGRTRPCTAIGIGVTLIPAPTKNADWLYWSCCHPASMMPIRSAGLLGEKARASRTISGEARFCDTEQWNNDFTRWTINYRPWTIAVWSSTQLSEIDHPVQIWHLTFSERYEYCGLHENVPGQIFI